MTARQSISEQIRNSRVARGWTQEQLAERSGMTAQHISKLELLDSKPQYHPPTVATMERLAKAFGVPLVIRLGDS